MRNRKFGVEIECGFRYGWDAAVNLLRDAAEKGDIDPYWWQNAGEDGTLLETRSPILQGKAGFLELSRVMNLLTENGGYVTTSDGMHVHHDAPDFVEDLDATKRLVHSWVTNRTVIEKFVPRERRNRGACWPWDQQSLGMLERSTPEHKRLSGTRHDLNIRALDEHGTIEIRLHPGCLDPVKAEAWIRFGQAFLNRCSAVKRPITAVETHDELLNRIRAHSHSRSHLHVYA